MINPFLIGDKISLEGTLVDFSIKLLDNFLTFKTENVANFSIGLNNADSSISPNFVTSKIANFSVGINNADSLISPNFVTSNVINFSITFKENINVFLTSNVVNFPITLKRV